MLAAAEALSEPDKHQKRPYAPCDTKHGEKAAKFVCQDGAKYLAECV